MTRLHREMRAAGGGEGSTVQRTGVYEVLDTHEVAARAGEVDGQAKKADFWSARE